MNAAQMVTKPRLSERRRADMVTSAGNRRNRVTDEVDNDVRLHVAQDQMAAKDAVFELLRQLRKHPQQLGWHGDERQRRRVGHVNGELKLRWQFADERPSILRRAVREVVLSELQQHRAEFLDEDVAGLRIGAQAA